MNDKQSRLEWNHMSREHKQYRKLRHPICADDTLRIPMENVECIFSPSFQLLEC